MNLTFRPIKVRPESWKAEHAHRPSATFRSSYDRTLRDLAEECRHAGATSAFIQVDVSDAQVRVDGQLYARAWPNHPGVLVTVETKKHGTLVYDTDEFDHWQSNLRAIALGMHDLRRLDRYGIAKRGQQYAGFREIGSGMAMGSGVMSPEQAATLLADAACASFGDDWVSADALLAEPDLIPGAYRDAAKASHPDAGGDPETFRLLTEARDVLVRFGAPS